MKTNETLPLAQPGSSAMNWLKIVIGFSATLVLLLFLGIFALIYCWWKKQKLL